MQTLLLVFASLAFLITLCHCFQHINFRSIKPLIHLEAPVNSMSARYSTRLAVKESRAKSESLIKITSYNVLSSHLSAPTHFTACSPGNLDPKNRLDKVRIQLQKEIDSKSIICLQEVSNTWAGALHKFFSNSDYHFITGLYGNRFNGYMGVGIAVPRAQYEIVDVDITRVADTKRLPRAPKPSYIISLIASLKNWVLGWFQYMNLYTPPFDMWDNVLYRTNQMISTRLKHRTCGKTFVVSTYHMPCMFKFPSVMVTHCALSAQHLQRFAKDDPYVYTGDFNIKPNSSMYDLLTKGTLEAKVTTPAICELVLSCTHSSHTAAS
jgi:2',5'-phosphodiesterase